MQPKKDYPTFNIRKMQRKGSHKHYQECQLYTPNFQYEKYPQIPTYTNPKRQKEIIIDCSVNEAILTSKTYCDMKQIYNENRRKNAEYKQALQQQIQRLKKEKEEAVEEERRLEMQRQKYQKLLNMLKEKIMYLREKNRQARQSLEGRMTNQADYLSNLLISMRFQAEYDHDIDPDQMTYEELLQLQEKIGSISRGLPPQAISKLSCSQLQASTEDQCTFCFCSMQKGQVITVLPECKHTFHRECLLGWLAKQKMCPLCKRQIIVE